MAAPRSVDDRIVVFGGGPAAATFAATRVAMGFDPVIVVENRRTLGGVFAQLVRFGMNSAHQASVGSVRTPGPTRLRPVSPSDTLNYIPNSKHQVECSSEYPDSFSMAKAVRLTLKEYAETYTNAHLLFDSNGFVFDKTGVSLGQARRIIFAGGLVVPPTNPTGPSIMSGYQYLQNPVRDLAGKKIAVVGAGATAAQCVEIMVGDGDVKPTSLADMIAWYGDLNMPVTKASWMSQYHARYAGLGRHFPQDGVGGGTIRPFASPGIAATAGEITLVNQEVFDLTVWCTGFNPAPCSVPMNGIVQVGGMQVALSSGGGIPLGSRVFTIGSAAALNSPYLPVPSKFTAATAALYNTLPRIAAFAGALPA